MARNRKDRKMRHRTESLERQQERAERTPELQWAELDRRLGEDRDACRERAVLYLAEPSQ